MTKKELIYRIQTRLGGGHATADIKGKYRDELVSAVIGDVFNDLVVKVHQNSQTPNKSELDAYSKLYYALPVQPPDYFGKEYIAIPTGKLIQLPNNNAIRAVFTVEATPKRCLYRELYADQYFSQLEVDSYLDVPRFEVFGENIYFTNLGSLVGYINLQIIVPWSEYLSTEKVPMPLENDSNMMDIVVQKILQSPVQDKIIDANVTQ